MDRSEKQLDLFALESNPPSHTEARGFPGEPSLSPLDWKAAFFVQQEQFLALRGEYETLRQELATAEGVLLDQGFQRCRDEHGVFWVESSRRTKMKSTPTENTPPSSSDWETVLKQMEQLRTENARFREALEWYTQESVNHHNYHSLMITDLTLKAREALSQK